MEKMKQANGKNQQGSVLLAVTCMGMVCMTLATVALSLVKYTTGATARNVMRSQAKVTAEACLSEFVGQYLGTDPVTGKANYEKLETLAAGHSAAHPLEVQVNPGDANFQSDYGETVIQVYEESGGFKVTSKCTFGGDGTIRKQTQTASVKFAAAVTSPMVNNNALEATEGVDASTEKGCPIDGDIYLERQRTASGGLEPDRIVEIGSQDTHYNANLYSEFSISFSNQVVYDDVTNKSGTQNYRPNYDTGNGDFFIQAPTVWTDGYLVGRNNFTVKTTVGKTDANLYNGNTAPRASLTYPTSTKLENMDGFVYVDKQVLFLGNTANGYRIGDAADKPIDLYCGGLYSGSMNAKVQTYDTATNTWNAAVLNGQYSAAQSVQSHDGANAVSGNGGDTAFLMNGNLYCYENEEVPTNDHSQSGSLYILCGAHQCVINGDAFVEHNIYIRKGASLKVTGDLHVGGNIYVVDLSGDTMKVNPNNSGTISGNAITDNANAQTGYKPSGCVSYVNIDQTIDKQGIDEPRNAKPTKGYNATTGVDSATRTSLKDVYKDASTNDIFEASFNTTNPYSLSAKDIAAKYAEAMATPLSTKKYKDLSGAEQDLMTKHGSGDDTVYEIKSSCRLVESDFSNGGDNLNQLKVYSVKLTDEDIVIALPLNNNITNLIRVDSTERVGDVFVYMTYYDSAASNFITSGNNITINNCLYLNDTSGTSSKTFTISDVYDNGSDSFVNKTVTINASSQSYRNSKSITMNPGGKNICYVADITLYSDYTASYTINQAEFLSRARSKIQDSAVENNTEQGYQNYIIFFVPDDVNFLLGDNGQVQGIIYAPESYVEFGGSGTRVFGQVKCKRFKFGQENKDKVIFQIPAAQGSIIDFVGAANAQTTDIEIQYYEY